MSAPPISHVHKVQSVVRVKDGDTYVFDVDVDFGAHVWINVRLHGIDVYEHNTPEGENAINYVKGRFAAATEIIVMSYKDARSFERWVCDVWVDNASLEEDLRAHGFAKPVEHLGGGQQ